MVEEAKDLWFDEEKFIQQGVKQGVEKGRKEGREEGRQEILQLLLKHTDAKEISRWTGHSVQALRKLRKKAG